MEITRYEPSMVMDVATVYNATIAHVPHCWPASSTTIAAALAPAVGAAPPPTGLRDETAFVARKGPAILGFVHLGIEPRANDPYLAEEGVIRFLGYMRGEHRAGQALVQAATDYVRERTMGHIHAFSSHHRYAHYYMAAAKLSDEMEHVMAVLGIGGFERAAGEVYLDWTGFNPIFPPASPVDGIDVRCEWKDGRGKLPGLEVRAFLGEAEIARCWHLSGGEYTPASEAQEWAFCTSLHVVRAHQGKGLGRWLLLRALAELKARGYRHATISTAWDNYRAMALYSNIGYRATDWTYAWKRPGHAH